MSVIKRFKVDPKKPIKLKRFDARQTHGVKSKAEAATVVGENLERMRQLQYRLYAEDKQSLLIVLQGIDAAGKDGTVRHVFTGINPQGCEVHAFKKPSDEELAHDFLWRIHKRTPSRGKIGIFNRSHYEDVLVVRVHDIVPAKVWRKRYAQINAFEKQLTESGTRILKFFLYIDPDEQKERFQARLDDPEKNWKFSHGDLKERERWDDYLAAFEEMLTKCSTPHAPWHVVPANRKWFRNYMVSQIIRDTLEDMDPKIPAPLEDVSSIVIP